MSGVIAPLAAKPDTLQFRGLGLPARLCALLGLDFDAMTVREPDGGYHHAPLEDAIWGMAKDLVRARAEALDLVQGRPPGSSRWAAEFQKECRGAPPLGAAEALALGSARLRSDGPAHWSEALYILRDELRDLGEDYPDTSALWTGPLRAAAMLRRDREALTRIRKTLGCQPGREAAAVEFHEGWWSARVERVLEWAREDLTARGEVFGIIANGTPSPTAKSPALGAERLRDGGWAGRAAELLVKICSELDGCGRDELEKAKAEVLHQIQEVARRDRSLCAAADRTGKAWAAWWALKAERDTLDDELYTARIDLEAMTQARDHLHDGDLADARRERDEALAALSAITEALGGDDVCDPIAEAQRLRDHARQGWTPVEGVQRALVAPLSIHRLVPTGQATMQVIADVRRALLTPDGAHIVEHAAGVLQMLRSRQWSATVDLVHGGYGHGCPVCEALEADGHVGDCALASILCEGGR